MVSRAVRSRHEGPYEAAVVPRIADARLGLPTEVVAVDAEAAAEIARFDTEVGADLVPFEAVMLRTESASSSMIENLTSGARAILLAEMGSREKRNATLIVGNVAAMTAAVRMADDLDEAAVLAMHRALFAEADPDTAGRWRDEQVWIGGDSFGPHGADFVPPHHEHVPALMADLIAFARRSDLPVLTQAAIAHAHFETIHPFPDGNGRTSRAMVHAMLRRHRLTRSVTVPVSAGLLVDTRAYFAALTAYRAGDPAPIVARFAAASVEAVVNARLLMADLHRIRDRWDGVLRARRGAATWRLADLLLRQPVVDARTVARELEVSPANTARTVAPLVDAGVLTESTGFARNRVWQAPEVLSALDEFAARTGRRSLD
jgi:Fic family protein